MKAYADTKRRATPHDIHIGDYVLVRQQKKNKLSSFYDGRPYTITDINHSMITAKRDNHTVTRNSSFFKKLLGYSGKNQPIDQAEGDEEEIDDDVTITQHVTNPTQRKGQPQDQPQGQPQPPTPPDRRYPNRRNRQLPNRFNDFVLGETHFVGLI